MKTKYNILKSSAAVLLLLGTLSACVKKDFFDLKDRNGMDSRIWDNEASVQFLLNETYDMIMPEFPYHNSLNNFMMASDEDRYSGNDGISRKIIGTNGELIANDIKFIGTKFQGTNKGDNRYFDIARCNNAIAGLRSSSIDDSKKDLLKGQFYALRALAYFELTRLYGGVPLVLEPQNPSSPNLDRPRAKAAQLIKSIVTDLDSAIVMLPPSWSDGTERGKLTRGAASALKGKVLMYWASPQFNPVNDGIHPYVAARWDTAYTACKEAYELCKLDGYTLLSNYATLFSTEGASNKEAIIVRSYSSKVAKYGHDTERRVRPRSEGGVQNTGGSHFNPTWNLVKAYTMNDGTPISKSTSYNQAYFWLNRDPRLNATIAYNGSQWALSGKSDRRQWAYATVTDEANQLTSTGFYLKKYSDPGLLPASVPYQSDFGGNGFDWIEMRFAEVMLNLAECANEVNNLTDAKDMVRQIRKRAGIIEGTNDYGLSLATSKDDMRDLIMNERMVEFAMEGKRFHDLRRTRRFEALNGTTLDKVNWALKAPTATTKSFLESQTSTGKLNRDTININNKDSFSKFFAVQVVPAITDPIVTYPHYNFFGLPNTFMNSSPTLEQTIGWENGTFDPLK